VAAERAAGSRPGPTAVVRVDGPASSGRTSFVDELRSRLARHGVTDQVAVLVSGVDGGTAAQESTGEDGGAGAVRSAAPPHVTVRLLPPDAGAAEEEGADVAVRLGRDPVSGGVDRLLAALQAKGLLTLAAGRPGEEESLVLERLRRLGYL
jgi:hypothetical protein